MVDGFVGVVKVKPLVWERYWPGCYTVKSLKTEDNACDVVYYADRAENSRYIVNTVTKPGYFRCWLDFGEEFESLESAKAAAQADYEARIMAALDVQPMDVKISLDTSHVRAMLDDAEKSFSHLTTIAATITVNALRHGATHAQIMDFITGKSDFVNWLRDQVKPKPITVQDAAQVPEIAALMDARRRYIELVEKYNAKLHSVKAQRLRGDWSQDVTTEFREMSEAHQNFIAAAQTAADAALRAIAEVQ